VPITHIPPLSVGDRIELLDMPNDPSPIPVGATGIVTSIGPHLQDRWQVHVRWLPPHADRSLSLVIPPDRVRVL
jgi:hypothetical protein